LGLDEASKAMNTEYHKLEEIVNHGIIEYIQSDDGYYKIKLSKDNTIYEFSAGSN